ncbi:phosphorylase superfamily protein [Cordyceps javanica]|nr:phosphorylase superfamily protein [Cordyceps javanica]
MLESVSGWSAPSFVLLVSITCTSSLSASSHQPWFLYVDARLAMLESVSGWSAPSFVLRVSITCTKSLSASSYRPWFLYVDARLAMLVSVEGWSAPSFVLRVSITCTSSLSASSHRPWFQNVDASNDEGEIPQCNNITFKPVNVAMIRLLFRQFAVAIAAAVNALIITSIEIDGRDVFLGNVVISRTLVQFDYGRQYPGHFAVKKTIDDSLGRANKDVRYLLASLESEFGRGRLEGKALVYLKSLQEAAIRERRRTKYSYPGKIKDRLYLPTYRHQHQTSCDSCCSGSDTICELATRTSCEQLGYNDAYLVKREQPDGGDKSEPTLFIGCLGSGNTVMKSAEDRDRISADHGIIAFEMEGTGVWDEIPCIVVKGICDFSDSHKNKSWQDYTAATAAAAGRALLERYPRDDGDGNAAVSKEKLSHEDGAQASQEASSQPSKVTFGNQNSGFQAGRIQGSVSRLNFGGR